MRQNKPYISLQQKDDKYRVHVVIKLRYGLKVDTSSDSTGIQIIGKRLRNRRTSTGDTNPVPVDHTKLQIDVLKDSAPTTASNIIHLTSTWFLKDAGVEYIWVKVVLPAGIQPNDGAIGNYDDPDG